jgi:hypothetical protein
MNKGNCCAQDGVSVEPGDLPLPGAQQRLGHPRHHGRHHTLLRSGLHRSSKSQLSSKHVFLL